MNQLQNLHVCSQKIQSIWWYSIKQHKQPLEKHSKTDWILENECASLTFQVEIDEHAVDLERTLDSPRTVVVEFVACWLMAAEILTIETRSTCKQTITTPSAVHRKVDNRSKPPRDEVKKHHAHTIDVQLRSRVVSFWLTLRASAMA